MTQEEKQVLLKDLCARLPHGVKVLDDLGRTYELQIGNAYLIDLFYGNGGYVEFPIKPFLRPMSSMTEEEKTWANASYDYNKLTYGMDYAITAYVDYLYSIHIDCHNLITKGLALVAPEDMYKFE